MGGTLHGINLYRRNHIEPGLFFVLTFVNICLVSNIFNCLQVVDRTLAMCRRLNRVLSGKEFCPESGEAAPRAVNVGLCKWAVPTQPRAARAKKKKISPETRSSPCSKVVDNVRTGSVIFSDQRHIGLAPQGFGQERGVISLRLIHLAPPPAATTRPSLPALRLDRDGLPWSFCAPLDLAGGLRT